MVPDLNDPWLVAVWPGMGNVALAAGSYLIEELDAEELVDLPATGFFEVEKVEIEDGIARLGMLPSCSFYGWRNPGAGRDLLIFVGEAQPQTKGYEFAERVLDVAREWGVQRVVTFAAMATPLHPRSDPRVFVVATEEELRDRVASFDAEILEEGQISGLNGVLLAAAAEQDLEGLCLLGELPYFAIGVPNPKASMAVLRIFGRLADVDLDFSQLASQAEAVDRGLVELLDRLNKAAESSGPVEAPESFSVPEFLSDEEEDEDEEEPEEPEVPGLSPDDRARIERLFRKAEEDRAKALELKHELDRLGVFEEYEDRFLDLFKTGE